MKGSVLGFTIALTFIMVLLGIAFFYIAKLIGGHRELEHATDAGNLQVAKKSLRSPVLKVFPTAGGNGNFDIASSQWVGVGDPHQYYEVFDSHMTPPEGGSNRGYYSNPRMDRLLEAGDSILEPAARRAIYAQVQQLAADDLPYVSLWWDDNVVAMDRRLAGFEPYPNGSLISLATAAFRPANRAPRIAR